MTDWWLASSKTCCPGDSWRGWCKDGYAPVLTSTCV